MKPVLSPKEFAKAIGVSESSLKRWADEGAIRYSRTAGGHRRILIADALRFVRETHTPIIRPEILGLPDLSAVNQDPDAAEPDEVRLFRYLESGRAAEARGLIVSWYLAGANVASIIDGPVRLAMQRMGTLWHESPEGICIEHAALDLCIQALNQLRLLLPANEDGPLAVGGAPAGDPYIIPSLAVATVLAESGYQAVNLGPDTPANAFQAALRRYNPPLVWLTTSYVRDPAQLSRDITALAGQLSERNATLIIGGSAGSLIDLPSLPNLHRRDSMKDLAEIAERLRTSSASS